MKKVYFSPMKFGFYQEALKSDYLQNNSWPDDLVEISDKDYIKFALNPVPQGKTLVFRDKLLLEDTQPTDSLIVSNEVKWVESELIRVRTELEKVQDSDPRAVGTVAQWRDYRKNLRVWVESIVPQNSDSRPKAPDFKE